MTALRSKLLAIFLGIVCSIQMATVTAADYRNVELYFDPDSKQIVTEPGKNTIKLNTLQPIEDLEQKKQALISIENRLDTKLKALDDKLKQLEQLESAAPAAGISPAKAAPAAQAPAQAQDTKQLVGTTASQPASKFPISAGYGDKGFELRTDDGKFALQIQNRLQFRYVNPFDTDPRSFQDLARDQSSFLVRRARFRVNGHAFRPWIRYAMQYEANQLCVIFIWISPSFPGRNFVSAAPRSYGTTSG